MKFIFFKFVAVFITVLGFSVFVSAQTESERGIELYEKGDYPAAIEILEKATQTDKKDGIAWRFLGMAYARTKNNKQARKAFEKAEDFKDKDLDKLYDTPLKIVSKPRAHYTDEARNNFITGKVVIAVEFGADGKVRFVFPVHTLPYGLTENFVEAAKGMKFESAIKNDKAISVVRFLEHNFMIY